MAGNKHLSAELKSTRKLLNILMLSFVAIMALSAATGYFLFIRKFRNLEDLLERDRKERILASIQGSGNYLSAICRDWAIWEDTWRYMGGGKPEYEEVNLSPETLHSLNLNYMGLVGPEGRVKWQMEIDLEEEIPVESGDFPPSEFPIGLQAFLREQGEPALTVVGERVMLLAFHPIVRSENSREEAGTLYIGREVNRAMIDELARMIRVDFSISPYGEGPGELGQEQRAILMGDKYLLVRGKGWVRSYSLMENHPIGTTPILFVTENNRNLMALGRRTFLSYLLLSFLGVAVVAAGIIRFVTTHYLASVRELYRSVVHIREEGDLDFRIPVGSNDEFGRLCEGFNSLLDVIGDQTRELNKENSLLQEQTQRDELTGLLNKRFYHGWLESRAPGPSRGKAGALLMVDIDHFKLYNDRYGHIAGDRALRAVAGVLKKVVTRPTDFTCRYGGEEFLVIMGDTEREGAVRVAQKIMEETGALAIEHGDSPTSRWLTVSIGISCGSFSGTGEDLEKLIGQADRALYQSKNGGRNRYTAL